jgi:hypothetical protein
VDDADLASKRAFLQIQMLFMTRLSEATRGVQGAPLLTIPVKRQALPFLIGPQSNLRAAKHLLEI